MQTYGYIRVSTREQNEDRQIIALSSCDIPAKNLFPVRICLIRGTPLLQLN